MPGTIQRRAWPRLALPLIGALLGACDGGPGAIHALALPPPTVHVALGARHDVLVAACRDEISLQRLLTPLAATAIFIGFGRLDVVLYLPGAVIQSLIPECEPVGLRVEAAAIDGPWTLDPTENPAAFIATAEGPGRGTFHATVAVDGGTRRVETTLEAHPIDGVRFEPRCAGAAPPADGPILMPLGARLTVDEQWSGGGQPLTGYGIEPIVALSGEAPRIDRDRGVALTFEASGEVVLGSPFDPTLQVAFSVFEPADIESVELAPDDTPWFVGARIPLRARIRVDGAEPCEPARGVQLTVETPETCAIATFEEVLTVEALAADLVGRASGVCVVSAAVPGSPARDRIELPIYAPAEAVLSFAGFDDVTDLWAAGPDTLYAVGYDSDVSGRTEGLLDRVEGGAVTLATRLRGQALRAVHGGGGAVVAVGGAGRVAWLVDDALEADPDPIFDGAPTLYAVWVFAPERVFVGGDLGFLARFEDGVWSTIDTGGDDRITALYGEPDGAVVISGYGPPLRWRDGAIEPIPTPDGGPGGSTIRPIGDELWFLQRAGGPFSLRGDAPLPIPVGVEAPVAVSDVYAFGAQYVFRYRSGLYRVIGQPAAADGWLHLSADVEGAVRPTTGLRAFDGFGDRVYAVSGGRLLRYRLGGAP